MNSIEIEDSLGLTICMKQPVAIERGLGSYVWDDKGARYLDFTAGWGVTSLGHSHPVLVSAIQEQAARIMQNPNSGFTYSPVRARLLTLLQEVLPQGLTRVFFANSGAEANDAAVKLARKVTGRPEVIAVAGSFHGRTLGTLSLSGGTDNAAKYLPLVPDNIFVPFGQVDALAAALSDRVAAVLLEPVQGEGGVRVPPKGYLQDVCRAGPARHSDHGERYRRWFSVCGACLDGSGGCGGQQGGSRWDILWQSAWLCGVACSSQIPVGTQDCRTRHPYGAICAATPGEVGAAVSGVHRAGAWPRIVDRPPDA